MFVGSSHSAIVMEGAVTIRNGVGMSVITVSPVKLSMNSSECRECKGITSFEGFLSFQDVSVGDKRSSIG